MNSSDRRERNVQKEPDGEVGPQHPQHLRHQLQLIVLNPHRRAARCGRPRRRLGEAPVHVDVAVPPLAVVDRFDDDIVVQRPQWWRWRSPRNTSATSSARQPDRVQLQILLDDRLLVAIRTIPGQPIQAPATTTQQRFQRGDQAARAAFPRRSCRRAAAPCRSAAGWRPRRSRSSRS